MSGVVCEVLRDLLPPSATRGSDDVGVGKGECEGVLLGPGCPISTTCSGVEEVPIGGNEVEKNDGGRMPGLIWDGGMRWWFRYQRGPCGLSMWYLTLWGGKGAAVHSLVFTEGRSLIGSGMTGRDALRRYSFFSSVIGLISSRKSASDGGVRDDRWSAAEVGTTGTVGLLLDFRDQMEAEMELRFDSLRSRSFCSMSW